MEGSSLAGGHAVAQRQLHALVLLECVQQPPLRSQAASALMQGLAHGRLGTSEVTPPFHISL